jgi:hypothetical protein
MGEIFRKAYLVFAWLGKEDKYSRFATKWMREAELKALSIEEYNDLSTFFSRTYWSRLWIVQKLILAQRVVFICGGTMFSWHNIQIINAGVPVGTGGYYDRINAPNASALCSPYLNSDFITLDSVLESVHGQAKFQCQLPPDVVYGLLSLIAPTARIPVDYSLSLTELMMSVVDRMLSSHQKHQPVEYSRHLLYMQNLLVHVIEACCRAMGIPRPPELDSQSLGSKVRNYYTE